MSSLTPACVRPSKHSGGTTPERLLSSQRIGGTVGPRVPSEKDCGVFFSPPDENIRSVVAAQ